MTAKKDREPLDWVEPFLDALGSIPNVTQAAKKARISRKTVYQYRLENADFAERWDKCLSVGVGALEDEALRRAVDGVNEPIVSGGKLLGTQKRYSDTLLIFLLKAHRPELYNPPARQEHTGKDGGAIEHAVTLSWRDVVEQARKEGKDTGGGKE